MTLARLKKVHKSIWSLILCAAVLATSFIGVIMNTNAAAGSQNTGLVSFTDDFERDTITGSDSGWVEQKVALGGTSPNVIDGGVLKIADTGTTGHIDNLVMRPMTEMTLNQKASYEINNIGHIGYYPDSSANLHLRVTGTNTANSTSYFASVNQSWIRISKEVSSDGTSASVVTTLVEDTSLSTNKLNGNLKYRLEFVATGMYPTTLTATVYEISSNTAVATLTCTDSTKELQRAGTVGISTSGAVGYNRTGQYDNFVYQQLDTQNYYDDFSANTLDSGWVKGANANPSVSDGELILGRKNDGNFTSKSIFRSESSLNQLIEVDFKRTDANMHTFGPAIFARVQDTNNVQYASNNFYHIGVEMARGAKNNSTAMLRIYLAGNTNLSTGSRPSVNFNTEPDGKYRLSVSVTSNAAKTETTIIATIYKLKDNGEISVTAQVSATDTTAVMQKAGKVGFSYVGTDMTDSADSGMKLDNYKYFTAYEAGRDEENTNGIVSFEDEFNRDAISGNDSGWVEQKVALGGTSPNVIDGGVLKIADTGTTGHIDNLVMRPMTEMILNQKASYEINNIGHIGYYPDSSANLHLRVTGTNTANPTSYFASVNQSWIRISKEVSSDGTSASVVTTLVEDTSLSTNKLNGNLKYRLEFVAEGVNPTTLKATVYEVSTDTVVTTLTCTDSTKELQRAGTVGISTSGAVGYNRTGQYDNFVYQQTDTVKYYDDFEATVFDSSWIKSSHANPSVNNGVLMLGRKSDGGFLPKSIFRPESSLNQLIEVDFKRTDSALYNFGTSVLARVQDTSSSLQYGSDKFYHIEVNLASGSSTSHNGFLRINLGGNGNLSTGSKEKVDFASDPSVKHRLQVSLVSNAAKTETTIVAILYRFNADGTVSVPAQAVATDATAAVQNEGKIGLSYIGSGAADTLSSGMEIYGFNYLSQNVKAKEEVPENIPDLKVPYKYTDDFNRTEISGDDSGWIEKKTGADTQNKITDGVLQLTDSSTNANFGHVNDLIMRPWNEITLNHKASVEIENRGELSNYASANVHVRVVPATTGYASYFASINNDTLRIRRTTSTGTANLTGGEVKVSASFAAGHKYRLELSAQGVYPTALKATLYDVTDNNKVVAEALGFDETNDAFANLQRSGSVGLSATSNAVTPRNIAKMDNFSYEQTDTEKYVDTFDKTTLDSSWIKSAYANPSVLGGALKPAMTTGGNFTGKSILRSESVQNQLIEIDFKRADSNLHTFGPAVFARVQDTNNVQYASNNYYHIELQLAQGGANNTAGILRIQLAGATNLSVGSKVSKTFYSDPNAKHRLSVSVVSNADKTETTIVATLYRFNDDGTVALPVQVMATDSTAVVQNAGKSGITYIGQGSSDSLKSGIDIYNFNYLEQQDKPEIPLSPDPEVPFVFVDDFDRADKDINDNNGWIDQSKLVTGKDIASVKANKLVIDNSKVDSTDGTVRGRVLRPISEATVDQQVSVDVLNFDKVDSASVILRAYEIPTDETRVQKHSFYEVRLNKTQLTIHARMSWIAGRFAGASFEYKEGHKYRVVATAQGTLPTVVTATVYDLTDGNTIVAQATGYDESLYGNDERMSQLGGTVGLAYQGEEAIEFDNFEYKQLGDAKCHDIFNRANGQVKNNWVASPNGTSKIAGEQLVMNNKGNDNLWNALMLRPATESALNQSVRVEFTPNGNIGTDRKGPAPVLFARVKENGTGGYTCYYAQLTFTGGWNTTVSIYKVLSDGTTTLISEGETKNGFGSAFTGTCYVEFRAEGSSPTKLSVIMYKVNNGNSMCIYYAKTIYDNQAELQSEGTAGVSYKGATGDFAIDTFSYFNVLDLPKVPAAPTEVAEDNMIYFHGTSASGNFGQWIECEPGKEYVYKLQFKDTFQSGGFAPRLCYEKMYFGHVMYNFTGTTVKDEDTYYYTITFKVPDDAYIQQNGKARIFVGVHEGGLSSVGYATDFSVVAKDDSSNTNLVINGKFKQGLYGWCSPHSSYAQGVYSSEFVSLMPETEEIEVMEYNRLVFMRDDSDIYFDDGDWSSQLGKDEEEEDTDDKEIVETGTIKGQLLDEYGEPVEGAVLMLSPDNITVKTDSEGKFEFKDIPVGTYNLILKLSDGTTYEYEEELTVSAEALLVVELEYCAEAIIYSEETETDTDTDTETEEIVENDNTVDSSTEEIDKTDTEKNTDTAAESNVNVFIIIGIILLVLLLLAALIFVILRKKRRQNS